MRAIGNLTRITGKENRGDEIVGQSTEFSKIAEIPLGPLGDQFSIT